MCTGRRWLRGELAARVRCGRASQGAGRSRNTAVALGEVVVGAVMGAVSAVVVSTASIWPAVDKGGGTRKPSV